MKKINNVLITLSISIILSVNILNAQSPSNVHPFTINGKNYEVITEMKSFSNAASMAVSRGGYLAEVNSQGENDSIFNAIFNIANVSANYTQVSDGGGIAYVWLGGSDINTEGTWLWDGDNDGNGNNFWNGQGTAGNGGGSAVGNAYINWGGSYTGNPNEPDDYGAGQDAAAIGLAGWPAAQPGFLGNASEWNDINDANTLYFVVEYDCQTTYNTINPEACDSYTSPDGNTTWTSSGTYADTIQNNAGCDSIITINLTIYDSPQPDLGGDQTVCDYNTPVTLDAGSYAAYAWDSGANTQTITADTSGNYAVTVTDTNNCTGTDDINLTIVSVDTSVTVNGETLEANETGASYQWLDCDNNLSVISGETQQNYSPQTTGNYAVEVTKNGCTDTSSCHYVIVTGIDNINDKDISIYPIPADNNLTVSINNNYKNAEIRLENVDGRVLLQNKFSDKNEINLNLNKFSAGVYFIRLKTDSKNITRKVIIK